MALRLVLSMSAVGGAFSVILLLLKPFTKRFVSWQYYVWLVVLFVMLIPIPVNITSDKAPQKGNVPVNIAIKPESQEDELEDDTLGFQAESPKPQEIGDYEFYKSQEGRRINIDWNKAAAAVWLAGIIVFWSMAFISYGRFIIKMKDCPKTEGNIPFERANRF